MLKSTMRMRVRVLAALVLAAAGAAVHAAGPTSPAGLWKTLDDDDQRARSWVRISQVGGVYSGHIERVLDADAKPGDVCNACTDERRNQPIVGLLLIRNVRQSTSDATVFDGGDILDPDDGKVYRLRLKLQDDGRRLQVRGYLGPFYRTQVWQRIE